MKSGLQQGHADGLCGIYAILNFLCDCAEWKSEKPDDALRYVLDAVHSFGWLTPYTLTAGFEAYQLRAILDRLFDNYRMGFRAVPLQDVVRGHPKLAAYELLKALLDKDCAVICGHDSAHWLLLKTTKAGHAVWDSSNPEKPSKKFDGRLAAFSLESGVVMVPTSAPVAEITL
ncbi:MAG: hypothetical protein KYX69_04070 [Sphingomonas sp.]|uniref:hypothetical protein n=1 Tax=Sphingomonas sp. TaxID=28214 RepID=UPI002605D08C|nr:hypothetical protein [Sphingomonas sp.]MDK2766878.1 hypothetical protein [Sphingomonas sp.]